MTSLSLRRMNLAVGLAAALLGGLAACGARPTAAPTVAPTITPSIASPSPAPVASEAASPSSTSGFSFDAESVVGYYQTQGYACGSPQPSALAVGYQFTSCQLVDTAGRTRVVGVVTDPSDELADGFGSVHGTATETFLAPTDALDTLAGFLGAMLGTSRGESLLPWLASHLGDSFAETTIGDLHVATYIKNDDHSTLYVEVANQDYLSAPRPSPS